MKYFSLLVLVGVFLCLVGEIGGADSLEVAVALFRGEKADFSSDGGLLVRMGGKTFAVPPKKSVHFEKRGEEIFWVEKKVVDSSVLLAPRGGEYLLWGKRPYRGRILLKVHRGQILVLNRLSLEDYVKGTIKLEASPSWPEEALKAQIVVARTYALKNLGRHKEEGFDFCATVHCQRYGGVNAEDPRSNHLVEETEGIVLTYEGKLASVVYHSESGGYTDSALNVWGKDVPYLVAVPSPWEEESPHKSWQVELTKSDIERALKRGGYLVGSLEEVRFIPGDNGRMKVVEFMAGGKQYTIPASRFRETVGVDTILSTCFRVTVRKKGEERVVRTRKVAPPPRETQAYREWMERDWNLDDIIAFLEMREREREGKKGELPPQVEEVTEVITASEEYYLFEGRGWGHGVGLSQWGAVGMAERGFQYPEILLHYFPGCRLGRVRE